MQISKSNKLANVCYDIRGPVLKHAKRLEDEGQRILKLNIGNPAPFGFEAPEEILQDVIRNLPTAQGNMKDALEFNIKFWADQGEALEKRFASWATQ